jgi:hypothetical protein
VLVNARRRVPAQCEGRCLTHYDAQDPLIHNGVRELWVTTPRNDSGASTGAIWPLGATPPAGVTAKRLLRPFLSHSCTSSATPTPDHHVSSAQPAPAKHPAIPCQSHQRLATTSGVTNQSKRRPRAVGKFPQRAADRAWRCAGCTPDGGDSTIPGSLRLR